MIRKVEFLINIRVPIDVFTKQIIYLFNKEKGKINRNRNRR